MARVLENSVDEKINSLLDKLVDPKTESEEYARVMYMLGNELGYLLLQKIDASCYKIALASTVEDADFLGKGIIDILEKNGKKVLLTVFWNKRFKPNEENDIAVAPIIKEFHDEGYRNVDTLIIIKSIISNSCVVRTNLTKLIEEANVGQIFIVAPVLLRGAIKNLECEFDDEIVKRFDYLYFAEDDKKNKEGFVDPGIGGDVYKRLGFESQYKKNRFIPEIVRGRRYNQL